MLREIVTKAVVSKGKIADISNIEVEASDKASKAIGCWIINHHYLTFAQDGKVYAKGAYDVHVWYALNDNNDTEVYKKTIDYYQEYTMENNNFDHDNSEYKSYCVEYPTCTSLQLADNKFVIGIKKTLAVDVIGESKLLVQVSDGNDSDLGINPNYMNR